MKVWLVAAYEPIPGLDGDVRPLRCGMLAGALVAAGHEVDLWTSSFDHGRRRQRPDTGQPLPLRPGLSLHLLPAPSYRGSVSPARIHHNRVLARRFRSAAAAATRPALVYASIPTLELAEAAIEVATASGVPVVVDVRDRWPDALLAAVPRPLRAAGRVALEPEYRRARRILRRARRRIAVSDSYLLWARRLAGVAADPRDRVFPIGYPDAAPRGPTTPLPDWLLTALDRAPWVVTFVGEFGMSADLETVVDAARRMGSDPHGPLFVLAGDGPRARRVRARAAGLSNVLFTGRLERTAVRALLLRSHAGLAAYGRGATQSLPNKPFEYLSAGLPVLSSLVGDLRQLIEVEGVGLHYEPENPESLTAAVRRLADGGARKAMASAAQGLFESRFREGMIYPEMVRYLESIVDRPQAVPLTR